MPPSSPIPPAASGNTSLLWIGIAWSLFVVATLIFILRDRSRTRKSGVTFAPHDLGKVWSTFYGEHRQICLWVFIVPSAVLLFDAALRLAQIADGSPADSFGGAFGIIVGIFITLIVERKTEKKDEDFEEKLKCQHDALVDAQKKSLQLQKDSFEQQRQALEDVYTKLHGIASLKPVGSYRDVLTSINSIIKFCRYDEKNNERPPDELQNFYYLNPTASFGHTLRLNLDAVLEMNSDARKSFFTEAKKLWATRKLEPGFLDKGSPQGISRGQASLLKIINDNERELLGLMSDDKINVYFATLGFHSGNGTRCHFTEEYLEKVTSQNSFNARIVPPDLGMWEDDWWPLLMSSKQNPPKQIYLIPTTEDHVEIDHKDDAALSSVAKLLIEKQTTMLKNAEKLKKTKTHLHRLYHIPFQIVMSYNERTRQGRCLFYVANQLNLTTGSSVAAFCTEDRTFLEIFHRIYRSALDTYDEKHWSGIMTKPVGS